MLGDGGTGCKCHKNSHQPGMQGILGLYPTGLPGSQTKFGPFEE